MSSSANTPGGGKKSAAGAKSDKSVSTTQSDTGSSSGSGVARQNVNDAVCAVVDCKEPSAKSTVYKTSRLGLEVKVCNAHLAVLAKDAASFIAS